MNGSTLCQWCIATVNADIVPTVQRRSFRIGIVLCSKHSPGSLRSWCRRVSRVPRPIEREALNVVQELYKLSAHNCSKVLGVLLEFCDSRTPNTP